MVRACSAINCSNRNFSGNPPAFHKFPLRDKVRLREWIKNMQRRDFSPTNTCYLCSDHFEDTSYWKGHRVRSLKDDAVPTIFDFTTSDIKKTRKRRVAKVTSKDDSSVTGYPSPAKKITLKCKKKNKNYRTPFSIELGKRSNIPKKLVISDTNTDSSSDVDSVSFIDKLLMNNSHGEIIILNVVSDQEVDLIKDKYVKADHSYVWPVPADGVIEAAGKALSSGVTICKKRPVKSDDISKSIGNMETATISNDFTDNVQIKTLHFDIANFNRIPDSQIVQNECNASSVMLNNSELDFETDIFKSLALTDKELFETIQEMGKSNAVILVVKDDQGNKQGYEQCQLGEILKNLNSSSVPGNNTNFETMELGGEITVGCKRGIHEKSAELSSKFVCNDTVVNGEKLIGSYDDFLKDGATNDSGELEIGEFYNGGLKIAGEIGKSNAEVIKILQLKNFEDSEDLINTINTQKEEINKLKKLLQYERAKREIL